MTHPMPLDPDVFDFYDGLLSSTGSNIWSMVSGLATVVYDALTCVSSCGPRPARAGPVFSQALLPADRLDLDLIAQEMAEQGKTTEAQAVQRLADVEQAQDFAKNEAQRLSDELQITVGIGAQRAATTAEAILIQAKSLNLEQIRSYCFPQLATTFTDALEKLSPQEAYVQTSYNFLLRILGTALSLGGLMEAVQSEDKQQDFKHWLNSLQEVAATLQQPHGFQDQATGTRALTLEARRHVNFLEVLDGVPRFVVDYSNINQDFELYCDANRFELAGGKLCQIDVPLPSQMGQLRLYFWSTALYSSNHRLTTFDDFFVSTFPEASNAIAMLSSARPAFPAETQHHRMDAEDDAELTAPGSRQGPAEIFHIGGDSDAEEMEDAGRSGRPSYAVGTKHRSLGLERQKQNPQLATQRPRSRGLESRVPFLHLDPEQPPRLHPSTWGAAVSKGGRRRSRSR